jgi:hypothetical protein
MSDNHTPGPWRWEFNGEHRRLHLVGGRPRYDLTILDFGRWGMNGATMRLRDTAHDGMQLLYRIHERPDWIAPEAGREHHKDWHQLLTHPDARLIAAAPDLLEALKDAAEYLQDKSGCSWLRSDFQRGCRCSEDCSSIAVWKQARAAIAKAEGQ